MSEAADSSPDISACHLLETFLRGLDEWRDLVSEWDGMTPRALADFQAGEPLDFPGGTKFEKERGHAAEAARAILEIIDAAAPIVVTEVAARGGDSKLVYDWCNAQGRQHGDTLARMTWDAVRAEVAHALLLAQADDHTASSVGLVPKQDEGADSDSGQAKGEQAEGASAKKGRGGKRPLEKSNPLKLQVYQRIQQEHRQNEEYVEIVMRLKGDKDFDQQIKDAGLKKLDTKLVRTALAFFDQQKRAEAQESRYQFDLSFLANLFRSLTPPVFR